MNFGIRQSLTKTTNFISITHLLSPPKKVGLFFFNISVYNISNFFFWIPKNYVLLINQTLYLGAINYTL